jgi:hypothetical protein
MLEAVTETDLLHAADVNQVTEQMTTEARSNRLQKKQHEMCSAIILNDPKCYSLLGCFCSASSLLSSLLQNCLSEMLLHCCVLSAIALQFLLEQHVLLYNAHDKYSFSRKCQHKFKVH